jgi:hypothetical protein
MLRTGKTQHYHAMLRMSLRTHCIMPRGFVRRQTAALFMRSVSYRFTTFARPPDLNPEIISDTTRGAQVSRGSTVHLMNHGVPSCRISPTIQ